MFPRLRQKIDQQRREKQHADFTRDNFPRTHHQVGAGGGIQGVVVEHVLAGDHKDVGIDVTRRHDGGQVVGVVIAAGNQPGGIFRPCASQDVFIGASAKNEIMNVVIVFAEKFLLRLLGRVDNGGGNTVVAQMLEQLFAKAAIAAQYPVTVAEIHRVGQPGVGRAGEPVINQVHGR